MIQWVRAPISFFFMLLLFLNTNCNSDKSEYAKLEDYYNKKSQLHINLSDSLMAFCKENETEVRLKQGRVFPDNSQFGYLRISFSIHFKDEATFYPIEFDSALNRHDPYPEKTLGFRIPINIIEDYSETIYWAISADSTQTFFADEWDVKFQLGTQGDVQYGILISADTNISNRCAKRLSANVCLTKGTVP